MLFATEKIHAAATSSQFALANHDRARCSGSALITRAPTTQTGGIHYSDWLPPRVGRTLDLMTSIMASL